jgi:hypothetical protein
MINAGQMRLWEERFRQHTQLADRSHYKIYYCHIRPAAILVLGINPGGDSEHVMPNGMDPRKGKGRCAASAAYYEGNEHDLLDCQWRENNVVKLLAPLVGGNPEAIRDTVVKTNMAFRRSTAAKKINLAKAMDESAPILAEIMDFVNPRLVLLTGVKIADFNSRYCEECLPLSEPLVDSSVRQTVFWPCLVRRKGQKEQVLAVQVAHASQFSWTYEKYAIPQRIAKLQTSAGDDRASTFLSVQETSMQPQ